MPKKFLLLLLATLIVAPHSLAQAPTPSACDDLSDPAKTQCINCVNILPVGTHVWTAIGCLNAGNPTRLVGQLLGWAVGVGGGIAFLLIVYAGFQIATAAGDPKRVQAARELLVSAITGLLLIVFSIFLLNLIGFKLLDLGRFGLPPPNP